MLGRNHATYAAAVWLGAYPAVAAPLGLPPSDPITMGATTLIAAGAGVVPDLDHPDAYPSRQFGFLTKVVSWITNKASGGHRAGTHTVAFAALLGAAAHAIHLWPTEGGRIAAAAAAGFCVACGTQLLGPSLGLRVHWAAPLVAAGGIGWWTWHNFTSVSGALWAFAAGGVLIHCACDMVTKGGVPVLMPFTRRRFCLKLFRVGGPGEQIASALGVAGLTVAVWRAVTAATF